MGEGTGGGVVGKVIFITPIQPRIRSTGQASPFKGEGVLIQQPSGISDDSRVMTDGLSGREVGLHDPGRVLLQMFLPLAEMEFRLDEAAQYPDMLGQTQCLRANQNIIIKL